MATAASSAAPRLAIRRVTKTFGGVRALRAVAFEAIAGEVHALVGENGAGKSTLMKILAGHFPPDAGEVQLDGQSVRFRSPHDALRRGIAMVHQEPLGVPDLTVAENVFLGCEPGVGPGGWLDRRRQHREAAALFDRLRLPLDPSRRLRELGLAAQQGVEIARALVHQARILIMDEPTSAISELEVQALLGIVRDLQRRGVTILYVSHRLEEVLQLADRVSVLRDGQLVTTAPAAGLAARQLVAWMAGREATSPPDAPRFSAGAQALEVRGLGCEGAFCDITFAVRCGEVVGLAGLVGAGRTEVARAIFGLAPTEAGEIRLHGQLARITDPASAIAHGIAMVTEDRRRSGIVPMLSLQHNLTLSSLERCCVGPWVRAGRERAVAGEQTRVFAIKAEGPDQPIEQLSGGNQQKAMLARALLTRPRLLILDEPTRGVDVAAKAEIHALIRRLAREGLAVLLISSELPEVLALSDRVLVMRQGRLVAECDPRVTSAREILHHAMPA